MFRNKQIFRVRKCKKNKKESIEYHYPSLEVEYDTDNILRDALRIIVAVIIFLIVIGVLIPFIFYH